MLMDQDACPKSLFLAIVGTAEANSEHPLAQAICNYVKEVRNIQCTQNIEWTNGYIFLRFKLAFMKVFSGSKRRRAVGTLECVNV